jgi:hypothetical protein
MSGSKMPKDGLFGKGHHRLKVRQERCPFLAAIQSQICGGSDLLPQLLLQMRRNRYPAISGPFGPDGRDKEIPLKNGLGDGIFSERQLRLDRTRARGRRCA